MFDNANHSKQMVIAPHLFQSLKPLVKWKQSEDILMEAFVYETLQYISAVCVDVVDVFVLEAGWTELVNGSQAQPQGRRRTFCVMLIRHGGC